MIVALLAGCIGEPEEPVVVGLPEVTMTVEKNPHNPFSRILTVDTDADVMVEVRHAMGTTPPQPPGEVLVLGLTADTAHTLTVLVDGEEAAVLQVTTEPLPEGLRSCSAEGPLTQTPENSQEVVCTNSLSPTGITWLCVDRTGEPVWSLQHPDGELMLAVQSLPGGGAGPR